MEMILSLTTRVVGYERLLGIPSGFVFAFFINDGTFVHRLYFTDDGFGIHNQFFLLDTAISRDYALEMHPGGGFELHVDGELFATGVGYEHQTSNLNFISFGDASADENVDTEITALSFTVGIDQIAIDTKPSSELNSIDPNSKESFPVAVLTTDAFDAAQLDWETVRFGPAGATESHGLSHVEDVDNDGDPDLVLHFNTRETGLVCGDSTATLSGETFGGKPVTASDVIRTVNCPE
jgi:hypothetical protein